MSLYRRGTTYWIKIAVGGKAPVRESTGTDDLQAAKEYHAHREAELWRHRALGERPRIALADAITTWLTEHAIHKRSYADDVHRVRSMLPVLPDLTIDLIKASTLTKLHADIVKLRKCKASTANRYLEIISAVLNYAFKRDEITHVPAIPYVAERKKAVEFLTQEEANRLLAELPDHLARMAKFALATGLREAETFVYSNGDRST